MGMTHEGTYVLDGKRVKITISGDTTIMTIDDQGCLDAGGSDGQALQEVGLIYRFVSQRGEVTTLAVAIS